MESDMQVINEMVSDYQEICRQRIISEFGRCPTTYDPMYLYQRYMFRRIPQNKRMFHTPRGFNIPNEHGAAFAAIQHDIEAGNCLKKYQSRLLDFLEKDDDLLSHWGIQHLHLSATVAAHGYVTRSRDLLFVYFTNSDAYVIGVYPHGAWCDLSVLEVMHQNWPKVIAPFRHNMGENPLSEDDHKILRKSRVSTTFTALDGTQYFPPSFGVSMNGAPAIATLRCGGIIFELNTAFEAIKSQLAKVLAEDPDKSQHNTCTIGMELHGDDRVIYVRKETGFRFT